MTMRNVCRYLSVAAALACSASAHAEVVQASDAGFVVSNERSLPGISPSAAWAMLVLPGQWWDSAHSWSGDAANMTLDPRAGGCFCEAIPPADEGGEAGSVEHMRVIHVRPGAMLRMDGTLGPLQSEALTGVLTIELAVQQPEVGGSAGTAIRWTYIVGGYTRYLLTQIAPAVDQVLAEQMSRLAARLQAGGSSRRAHFDLRAKIR